MDKYRHDKDGIVKACRRICDKCGKVIDGRYLRIQSFSPEMRLYAACSAQCASAIIAEMLNGVTPNDKPDFYVDTRVSKDSWFEEVWYEE